MSIKVTKRLFFNQTYTSFSFPLLPFISTYQINRKITKGNLFKERREYVTVIETKPDIDYLLIM